MVFFFIILCLSVSGIFIVSNIIMYLHEKYFFLFTFPFLVNPLFNLVLLYFRGTFIIYLCG
jgi:hypothetical protein